MRRRKYVGSEKARGRDWILKRKLLGDLDD